VAQVLQAALLVGTEGAEPLRISVHPNGESFPDLGVELDLVMALTRGQEGKEDAGRG